MLSSRFKPWHVPLFLAKYAWLGLTRRPVLVHFEVTMRCNARCGFCDYWKTPSSAKNEETERCAEAARFFNPMLVTFTGGEPLLRRDLEDLVASVRDAIRLKYITLLTHGGMLTPERGRSLWHAGVSQFNVSLDYVDGRHDTERGIPGLTQKIFATVSSMRSAGIDAIRFNTVIKRENIDHVVEVVRVAQELGVGVNFSVYTDFKNGNVQHLVQNGSIEKAEALVAELLAFKLRRRGVITNSDY
jgi:MoaA/NifB/PqqE/SkfB family radical SAM enzyme